MEKFEEQIWIVKIKIVQGYFDIIKRKTEELTNNGDYIKALDEFENLKLEFEKYYEFADQKLRYTIFNRSVSTVKKLMVGLSTNVLLEERVKIIFNWINLNVNNKNEIINENINKKLNGIVILLVNQGNEFRLKENDIEEKKIENNKKYGVIKDLESNKQYTFIPNNCIDIYFDDNLINKKFEFNVKLIPLNDTEREVAFLTKILT